MPTGPFGFVWTGRFDDGEKEEERFKTALSKKSTDYSIKGNRRLENPNGERALSIIGR